MRLPAALALAAAALCGCKLDSFLYGGPRRTDAYVFQPVGQRPEETVAPDRIERLRVDVDGTVSLGAVWVRGSVQPPRGYVLYFHGNGGNLDTHFPRTKRWANLGFDVFSYDYRGWGTSTNSPPTEAGLDADGRAAVAAFESRLTAGARVVFYGHSLGTAANLQQSVRRAPPAVILEAPFASIQRFAVDSSQMDVAASFVTSDGWDSEARIANLAAPVLLLHGKADDFVRPEFSEALYARAGEGLPEPERRTKELVLVDGGGHSDLPAVLGAEYDRLIHAFVDANVP